MSGLLAEPWVLFFLVVLERCSADRSRTTNTSIHDLRRLDSTAAGGCLNLVFKFTSLQLSLHFRLHQQSIIALNFRFELVTFSTLSLHYLLLINSRSRPHMLNREEHRPHLSQPSWIRRRHTLHILFASHDQLVIHHVVRCKPKSIDGARWMQNTWNAWAQVVVLANALHPSRIMEITGTDGFPNWFIVKTRAFEVDLEWFHDVKELGPHFTHLFQGFPVDKMLACPFLIVFMPFPLFIDV